MADAHISPRTALVELRKIKNRTRSQVVRNVLNMTTRMPDATMNQLRAAFPEVEEEMSVEETITLMLVSRVLRNGDVNAYNALMDSAYGKPTQQLNVKDESISQLKMPQFLQSIQDITPINDESRTSKELSTKNS
jgi:hypothetical protein